MLEKIKSILFENKGTRQTVAKNTFWLTVSNFGGRLIKAAVIIYGARVLGTAEYGVFSYALTLAGFLTLFMEPGINGILMRDASKTNDEERRAIFGTTFVIKLCLLALGMAGIVLIGPLISTLPGAKLLLPIVAVILFCDTLREFFSSILRTMERMEWEALIFILTNIGIVIFGFIFILRVPTASSFGWGYALGDAVGVFAAIIILRPHLKRIFSYFSAERVMPILNAAWPFAVSGALGALFVNTDILIISWMRSASEVGIYSAGIRIIQTLYLIPGIVQYSTLPLFSRLAKKDNPKFRLALEKTLSMIFFASIPLSIGGIILGTPLLGLVFGAPYRAGGIAFEILMATLLFDFAASIIINALFVYDHQRSLVVSSALGGLTNLALDLALIPTYGMAGSAVATFIAQVVNNGYLWYVMKKVNYFSVASHVKKIVAAGAVMGAVTALLALANVNVLINIALSGLVYFIVLRILREPLLIEVKRLIFPVVVEPSL